LTLRWFSNCTSYLDRPFDSPELTYREQR